MTKLLLKDLGHWKYASRFDPDNWYGFLYCIENKKTNQFYIGRKQFRHQGKKRSKTYNKPMPWKAYQSSSVHLKKDIGVFGADQFKFEIIDLYKTKGGLNYVEAWAMMVSEVMTATLEDGKTPRFYNRQIPAVRWVPKEVPTKKTRNYIAKLKKRF